MLIVAKLAPGREAYYERSVASGLDAYDSGRGESPGVWVGRGATSLGLEGVVSPGQLGALMRGLDPSTHERLRRHPKARVVMVERTNRESGQRRAVQRRLAAVAGFDLVFSAPKSVSLLHALGGEGTRRTVGEAHRSAWHAALAYLEEEACVLRRGAQGLIHEHAQGFVAAAYEHRTSRAHDPHLHTHVIAGNVARSPSDGKWRALDGGAILRHYKRAASYLYQAHLRFQLSRLLGVEWGAPLKGSAELKGVSRAVIDEFSTRRREVAARLDEEGLAGFAAARFAGLETRTPKKRYDLARLRAGWSARAAEHGLDAPSLDRIIHRSRYCEPTSYELSLVAQRLLGPTALAGPGRVFSEPELVMAWAEAFAQGAPAEQIRCLVGRFLEIDGVHRVGVEVTPGRPGRHSAAVLAVREPSPLRPHELWFAKPREREAIGRLAARLSTVSAPEGTELETLSAKKRPVRPGQRATSSRAETRSPALSPRGRERHMGRPGPEL